MATRTQGTEQMRRLGSNRVLTSKSVDCNIRYDYLFSADNFVICIHIMFQRVAPLCSTLGKPASVIKRAGVAGTAVAVVAVSSIQAVVGGIRTFGTEQKPNRFTRIYNEMQVTCPEQIELYAKCVVAAQQTTKDEGGASPHNACAEEFRALKECFRMVRKRQQP
jgi:hypothetical protein